MKASRQGSFLAGRNEGVYVCLRARMRQRVCVFTRPMRAASGGVALGGMCMSADSRSAAIYASLDHCACRHIPYRVSVARAEQDSGCVHYAGLLHVVAEQAGCNSGRVRGCSRLFAWLFQEMTAGPRVGGA